MRFARFQRLTVAAGLLFFQNSLGASDAKSRISEAWRERQSATNTLTISVRSDVTMTITEDDFTESEKHISVALDENKFSLRLKRARRDGVDAVRGSTGQHAIFDGTTSKFYTGLSNPKNLGTGNVTDAPYAFGAKELMIRPILLVYRPLLAELSQLPLEKCVVRKNGGTIDGIRCWVLAERTGRISREYWLDPERAFLPLRYQNRVRGRDRNKIDIRYRQHGDDWRLARWDITQLNTEDGSLVSTMRCDVVATELNKPVPTSEFEINYPPRTRIEDAVAGRSYRIKKPSRVPWWLVVIAACSVICIVATKRWLRRETKRQ